MAETGQSFHSYLKQHRVGLAPMEGVTGLATRLWFAKTSAPAFAWTPFLRVTDHSPKKPPFLFAPELDTLKHCVPYRLIPQVMTADPQSFLRIAPFFLDRAEFVDLNAGCPSPRCQRGGAGSTLLRQPTHLRQFSAMLLNELGPKKVSLKMRIGFDSPLEFPPLMQALGDLEFHHVCVHGRTRLQKYQGRSDWQAISTAQHAMHAPIIGSGDILDGESLKTLTSETIPYAIIGRGALRNPWIFDEIRFGAPIAIQADCLRYSLAVYSYLQGLQMFNPIRLVTIAATGAFYHSLPSSGEAWQTFFAAISEDENQHSSLMARLPEHRSILGQTKMLWCYLRSSLSESFWCPSILRTKTLTDFFSALDNMIQRDSYHKEGSWVLKPHLQLNPLFQGQKKEKSHA